MGDSCEKERRTAAVAVAKVDKVLMETSEEAVKKPRGHALAGRRGSNPGQGRNVVTDTLIRSPGWALLGGVKLFLYFLELEPDVRCPV